MTFERLGGNREFRKVYRAGKTRGSRFLVMVVLKDCEGPTRYGFSVSKKVGNSVIRHRVTRLFREAVRALNQDVTEGNRIIIIAKPEIKEFDLNEIRREIVKLFKSHRVWRRQSDDSGQTDITECR